MWWFAEKMFLWLWTLFSKMKSAMQQVFDFTCKK